MLSYFTQLRGNLRCRSSGALLWLFIRIMWWVGEGFTATEGWTLTHTHTHIHAVTPTTAHSAITCSPFRSWSHPRPRLQTTPNTRTSHPLLECTLQSLSGYECINNFWSVLIWSFVRYAREAGRGFKAAPGGLWVWPLNPWEDEVRMCVRWLSTSKGRKWKQSWAAQCLFLISLCVLFPYKENTARRDLQFVLN